MVEQEKKDKTVLNLANALTILRMILAPFFMIAVLNEKYMIAFVLILIATLTDFLDGQVARILKMQTRLGRMLDPLADKIIISFAILTFLIKFQFPLWIGILILSRDFLLLLAGSVYLFQNRKKILVPNLLGKFTTFLQMSSIVVFILNKTYNNQSKLITILLVVTAAFTIISGLVYLIKGYRLFFAGVPKKEIKNIPNKITLARILLIPLFLAFLLSDIPAKTFVATTIFIILALSDALDGYVARKKKQITNIGGLIDPIADKLLIMSALIFLIGKGVEAWIAYIIIAREIIITGLRMIAISKNQSMPAKLSGKIKTFTQVVAVIFVLLQLQYSDKLMLIAAIVTIYSGIEYIWIERKLLKGLF